MEWKQRLATLLAVGAVTLAAAPLPERDSDGDGIPDLFDFCPGIANTLGPDRDGDRIRDGCDLEPDGDGVLAIPFRPLLGMDARSAPGPP